jgi:leader peptidase (prepilin peptidase) / N-methyltransferase
VPTLADFPTWFLVAVAVCLGLVFGSFLNVVIYRLPLGKSVVRPGSACPGCGAPIRAWDNVPVLSFLVLRGRARCCGAPISVRYPLVEALGGLLAWAVLERLVLGLPPETECWRFTLYFAVHLALGLGLIAVAFIDLEHMLVPDSITLGGTLLAFASLPLRPSQGWVDALLGAGIGFLIVYLPFDLLYRLLRDRPGMGLGDAKLTLLAGAWFGWTGAVFALLAGAVQGTVFALVLLLVRGKIEEPEAVRQERAELRREIEQAEGEARRALEEELARDPIGDEPEPGLGKARLAFGPFLALATLEYLLLGELVPREVLAVAWP